MHMICRECKRVMSINELGGYAFGHFAKLLLATGLAACLAQAIKDYFLDPKRGIIDETMAGACNGLKITCPKCKKTDCWDPLSEKELNLLEQKNENTNITN